jgi:putative ABC transport system permease protein
MELWLGAISLGLCYGFLAMGVFITMRIYNFPDITADGSLTLGASVSAALIAGGTNPYMAVALSMLAGFSAGATTGMIHTKFRVNGLLSGILVTTGLYSVNLHIMGRSNIPLIGVESVMAPFELFFQDYAFWVAPMAYFFTAAAIFLVLLSLLFKTDFGLAMRATGDNETMIAAQGVDIDRVKIFGIGLSNAIIALSGSLVSQYQGFADINMGIGIIVFGLASVIIGESILAIKPGRVSLSQRIGGAILGAIIFRILVALALRLGLNPIDLKLVTAFFVLLAVALPQIRKRRE